MARSRWTARRIGADAAGFSLLEVLLATAILAFALTALAQMFVVSTRANSSARTTTFAAVLAQQKMEQLRGLTWGFDAFGLPLSDTTTDLTVVPESTVGGTGLSPSPAGSLAHNMAGYVDHLDANGTPIGSGVTPPANTVFVRRWSIEPLPTNPNNTLVLQVLVTRSRDRGASDLTVPVRRLPDEARIVSVKTRKAS